MALGVSGWAGTPVVGGQRRDIGQGGELGASLLATRCSCTTFPPDAQEPGDFLTGLGEICGRCPHWSLLQLLTEVGAPEGEWGFGPVSPLTPVYPSDLFPVKFIHTAHPFIL